MENPRSAYQIKAVEQQMRNEMQKIIPENVGNYSRSLRKSYKRRKIYRHFNGSYRKISTENR